MADSERKALVGGSGGKDTAVVINEKSMEKVSSPSLEDTGSYCFENFPPSDSESRNMMMSRRYPQSKAKSLSMKFIKSLSGLCCDNCRKDPFATMHNNSDENDDDGENKKDNTNSHEYDSVNGDLYNLKALQKSLSTISPLVSAPMMMDTSPKEGTTESIIGEYMCFCRFYKVTYNAGILTTLRFSLPCLRVTGSFHDEDMLALVELLLRHGNGALKYISRLDFSIASKEGRHWRNPKLVGFTSHGALALAKALQTTKYIRQVFLQRHRVGPFGSAALFLACRTNPSIEALNLRRCRIGERGAFAFCEIIMGMHPKDNVGESSSRNESGLIDVDLSANRIGHQGTVAIEKALERRMANGRDEPMFVNLEGNLVFPEIMNGVTHGLGVLLSLYGGYLLSHRVQHQSHTHSVSCGIYTFSLLALYLSSTLYHSFFTMLNTRYIFRVMDKCAIYILIAGSYTPFLQILMSDQPIFSYGLLGFLWLCGGLGIYMEAAFPTWKWKSTFSLSMYLGMGWAALICLPQMKDRLPIGCIQLVVLGGVAYTAGVPFFVRDNNLDHAIWHLFVLSGSILHWVAVFIYVAPRHLMQMEP